MYAASGFANNPTTLLSSSLIWLRSTPVPGDHGEGQVLAVLPLDRGDKSLSTPEDSLPVGKLGTSLSRPCHTLPCRSSLIGPAQWHAQPTSVSARVVSDLSLCCIKKKNGQARLALNNTVCFHLFEQNTE